MDVYFSGSYEFTEGKSQYGDKGDGLGDKGLRGGVFEGWDGIVNGVGCFWWRVFVGEVEEDDYGKMGV